MIKEQWLINSQKLDTIGYNTMQLLDLPITRTTNNRQKDRRYMQMICKISGVNLQDYAVHHTLNGDVVLVERTLHTKVHHVGYFGINNISKWGVVYSGVFSRVKRDRL